MKASSKHPCVESFSGVASHPPFLGDPTAKEFVDPTTVVDPPPSTLGDSSIRSMLDTVMTIQAAHGALGSAIGFGEHLTVFSTTSF